MMILYIWLITGVISESLLYYASHKDKSISSNIDIIDTFIMIMFFVAVFIILPFIAYYVITEEIKEYKEKKGWLRKLNRTS